MDIETPATAPLREVSGTVLPDHVPDFLPEGIYIALDELEYHNDPALGSSDMKRLAVSPPDFWFNSKFNPLWKKEEESPSLRFGRAAHKCVLEGPDQFRRLYAPQTESGATKAGKAQIEDIRARGMTPLKADDYERIEVMSAMVRQNPKLMNAFDGGVASEISIFWKSKSGIRKKCRIDYLKPRASIDLKTIANQFDEPFPLACRKQIAKFRYDIQAAHYAEGRAQMARLLEEKAVFTDDEPEKIDMELLRRCATAKEWAWVWIFVQSRGAPLTWGCTVSSRIGADGKTLDFANPILEIGQKATEIAELNWATFCKRFDGLGLPWVLEEPLEEVSIDDFPGWAFR